MLKILSVILIIIGGCCLIGNYWTDLGHFINHEVGNERKFNFWKNTGITFLTMGLLLGIINFLFV